MAVWAGALMFDDLSVLAMAKKRMDWLAERQKVLAQNIANANTPDYRPQDLKPVDFQQALREAQPPAVTVTHPRHVVPAGLVGAGFDAERIKTPYETAPDGNAVVLEEQMQKVGDNRGAYELAANLLSKHFKMLRTTLGRN